MTKNYDALIVGSGAVSNVFAARLAEAGKKVLVLESGPARKADDLISSQIWARRLKWGSHPVNELESDEMLGTNMNFGIGYGGAAIHHYAVYPRFTEQDFKMKTLFNRAVDWPMSYDDVRPYYDKVQDFIGVSGDAKNEPGRPPGKDYPMGPVPAFRHAQLLGEGFEKIGIKTSAMPMGVLTQPHNGRPACIWDGWCDAGCPIGAIANPLMTYMPRAEKAGAEFRSDCHITRILTDKSGTKATGVEYYNKAGERFEAYGDMVVLGANTIENIRIMMNSKDGGLANKSQTLGKYLMVHPAVTLYGLYDEETQCHMGATGGAIMARQADKTANPDGIFGAYHWEMGLVLKPNDLLGVSMTRPDLIGEELDQFIKYGGKRMAAMCAIIEDQPMAENRVELDSVKDSFGMPRAKVHYKFSEDGLKLAKLTREQGMKAINASGAKRAWGAPLAIQHIMGGTRMGETANDSVCDSFGITHELSNLVIGGQSTFPTGSDANTTFFVQALAERTADHLLNNWQNLI